MLKKFGIKVTREQSKTKRDSDGFDHTINWSIWAGEGRFSGKYLYIKNNECGCGCSVQYSPKARDEGPANDRKWISKELRPAVFNRSVQQARRLYKPR